MACIVVIRVAKAAAANNFLICRQEFIKRDAGFAIEFMLGALENDEVFRSGDRLVK